MYQYCPFVNTDHGCDLSLSTKNRIHGQLLKSELKLVSVLTLFTYLLSKYPNRW